MKLCFMALHEFALFLLSASCRMLHIVNLSRVITFHVVVVALLHLWVFRLFVLQGVTCSTIFEQTVNKNHCIFIPFTC